MSEDSTPSKQPQVGKYILLALVSCGAGYIVYQTYNKKHTENKRKIVDDSDKASSVSTLSISWSPLPSVSPGAPRKIIISPPLIASYSMDVSISKQPSMHLYLKQNKFQKQCISQPRLLSMTPTTSYSLSVDTYGEESRELTPVVGHGFNRQASQPKLALSRTFLGESSYRETVIFLLALATYRLFPKEQLIICNTFKFGTQRRSYFCRFQSNLELNNTCINQIENEMLKLSAMELELDSKFIDYKSCKDILTKTNQLLSARLVASLNRPCYRMVGVDVDFDGDEYSTSYYILQYRSTLTNTKFCSRFKLHASDDCKSHFVVKFPHNEDQMDRDDKKTFVAKPNSRKQPSAIRELYQHGVEMSKYLHIGSVSDINEVIHRGRFKELMLVAEAYHNRQIVNISNKIKQKRKPKDIKIILISGPSSSGKTTFASKLGIQLRLLGMLPTVLEVDMYYRNRTDPVHPRDSAGNLNFEVIEALRVTEFNFAINRLLNGEAIRVPKFDFKTGARIGYQKEALQLDSKNGVLIMEGIFCLNPKLLVDVKGIQDITFKIFICPISPFYALDNFHFISEQVMRLLRRISRDHFHRGKEADQVVFKWGQLSEGEDVNIFPYVKYADAVFNSALLYEICVLKVYSYPLLQTVTAKSKSYKDAQNLMSFLDMFFSMPDRSVPNDSLLMEFIGKSIFDEI